MTWFWIYLWSGKLFIRIRLNIIYIIYTTHGWLSYRNLPLSILVLTIVLSIVSIIVICIAIRCIVTTIANTTICTSAILIIVRSFTIVAGWWTTFVWMIVRIVVLCWWILCRSERWSEWLWWRLRVRWLCLFVCKIISSARIIEPRCSSVKVCGPIKRL